MTGNDFMLSAFDDNIGQQARIHKSSLNESKGAVIDYPKRAVKGNETVLTGMERTAALTQYLFVLFTIVSTCACAIVSLCNYVLTAADLRIIRVGFVGIFVACIIGYACSAQAYPSGRWASPLVNARLASARHRHDIYCFQASEGMVHNKLFLDSGASRTIIHNASMLKNVRPLDKAKTIQGLTGAQRIRYQGDLQLNMVNTTGKTCTVGLHEEERMHYRLNHAVNPQRMVALSNSGARGIKLGLRELNKDKM
jgi:hypothetical protein